MIRSQILPALLSAFLLPCAGAQKTTARVPYDGSDSTSAPLPIHIDQNCEILPDRADSNGRKKPRPYRDSYICQLESVNSSEHWEESISGHELLRTFVRITEHTFVLHDVADKQVMFVVQQTVPKGWFVDSDPQPLAVVENTAYFHVYVQPGQTVRLHVGMRREWPQKPKPI